MEAYSSTRWAAARERGRGARERGSGCRTGRDNACSHGRERGREIGREEEVFPHWRSRLCRLEIMKVESG